MSRVVGPLLALSVVILLAPVAAPPAVAQPSDAASSRARLELAALSGVLLPGEDLEAVVRVRNPGGTALEDPRVVATLHRRTISRLDYQLAMDRDEVGTVLHAFTEVLEPLAARRFVDVDLRQDADQLGLVRPEDQLGVYPLQLRLLEGEAVVDELTTSVVLAPETVENPVSAALLLPLDAPPALRPEGPYARGTLVDDLGAGGRLRALVDAPLDRNPAPLTVAPSGLLLDQVEALAGGAVVEGPLAGMAATQRSAARFLERTRALTDREEVEVVSRSYGPGDLVALARSGARTEVGRQVRSGVEAVAGVLDAPVTASVLWPPDGMTPAAVQEARRAGVDTLVLSESALSFQGERDLPFSPSPHRRLARDGGGLRLLVPDPWLEEALAAETTRGAPHHVQRIVGETAAVFFERPYTTDPRGLLLAPPREWAPPPTLPGLLAEQLDAVPWLDALPLSGLADVVPVQPDAVRLAAAHTDRGLDRSSVGELVAGRDALVAAQRVVVDDSVVAVERADQLLLAAGSVHMRLPRVALGRTFSRTVSAQMGAVFESVSLVESPPVLLSSIEGQVPVTLRNDAGVPLRVQVRLETQRYEFDDGPVTEPFTLPAQSTSTLAFTAQALAPGGVHQIGVSVEDAEGGTTLTTGTIVVRSTAISTTALLITAAAVLFLVGWWAREAAGRRRRRRGRAPSETPADIGPGEEVPTQTVPAPAGEVEARMGRPTEG